MNSFVQIWKFVLLVTCSGHVVELRSTGLYLFLFFCAVITFSCFGNFERLYGKPVDVL